MITFFSTAKRFLAHIGIIQRNALESWKRLHPDAEVILFGNEDGAEEVCRELGLRHEAEAERSPGGAVRADAMFLQAQKLARNDVLCYSNCDIVLTHEFIQAVERVQGWRKRYLIVGRRWDTDITQPLDFSLSDWQERILERAKSEGIQRMPHNLDYFVFPRGLYQDMPALVVGRVGWDQWMTWKALAQGTAVVDVSDVVCAIHQNHDYSHLPRGWESVASDQDARSNFELTKGHGHLRTIEDATFRLGPKGIAPNRFHWMAPGKRRVRALGKAVRSLLRVRIWHPLLNATRPMRHAAGLRKDMAAKPGRRPRHPMD